MEKNTMANPQRNGDNMGSERIKRITGYLVGTTDRWNDAKKLEHRDRVRYPVPVFRFLHPKSCHTAGFTVYYK